MNRTPSDRVPALVPASALVADHDPDAPGIDPASIGRVLWAERRRVGACALAGGVLLLALALLLPSRYVADVSLLEAPRPGGGSALDQLGLSAQMLGIKSGASANALTYPDLLRSRRLLEPLLASRFARARGGEVVLEPYLVRGAASPQRTERALAVLRQRFDVTLDRRTNLLRVRVTDRDPALAAAVANAAAAGLQDLVMRSLMTQAGANRRFVETRLAEARVELARAEGALARFRDVNRHPEGSPRLEMDMARLVRELRTREEVVIALTREYEMARVDENRDVPVLNVLDRAETPASRSWPRRGAMTASGVLLGLAVGDVLAWTRRDAETGARSIAEAA